MPLCEEYTIFEENHRKESKLSSQDQFLLSEIESIYEMSFMKFKDKFGVLDKKQKEVNLVYEAISSGFYKIQK